MLKKKKKDDDEVVFFPFIDKLFSSTAGNLPLSFSEKQERNLVCELAQLQLDDKEISILLEKDCEYIKEQYQKLIERSRIAAKARILKAQVEKAFSGNSTMLMWCGKHMLNQKDDVRLTTIEPEIRLLFQELESLSYEDMVKVKKEVKNAVSKTDQISK